MTQRDQADPVYPWAYFEGAPGLSIGTEDGLVVLNFGVPLFRLELNQHYAVQLAYALSEAAGARRIEIEL